MSFRFLASAVALSLVVSLLGLRCIYGADSPPDVGDIAQDFELTSIAGTKVRLTDAAKAGPVVLLVLRGYPGYQCPLCGAQVGQFVAQAEKFKAAGATVLMVYPGPSANLSGRAKEFSKDLKLPSHYQLLVDPDYTFTNSYHLRWDAPNETAYPSTFIIAKDRKITFAKISRTHGGRTKPEEILKALSGKS